MKQNSPEKSSVAWFKLAECLKRKERERAFLLYRLLMHSFEDNAFLKKLEGDMWLDFDTQEAIGCYLASALYYRNRNDYYEAYLIYKKVCEIDSQATHYIDLLLQIIDHTSFKNERSVYYARKLAILCNKKSFIQAHEFFQEQKAFLSDVQKNTFYQDFVQSALAAEYPNMTMIENYLKLSIEYLSATHQSNALQQFLTRIKALNEKWYQRAAQIVVN